MIDLNQLKAEERKAHKYDYSDRFYRDNWDDLVAAYERMHNAAVTVEQKVQETLGGYLYGYSDEGIPLWGDHVAETLAAEAVEQLKQYESVENNHE